MENKFNIGDRIKAETKGKYSDFGINTGTITDIQECFDPKTFEPVTAYIVKFDFGLELMCREETMTKIEE